MNRENIKNKYLSLVRFKILELQSNHCTHPLLLYKGSYLFLG